MFIALTTHTVSLVPGDLDLADHWAYLDQSYQQGLLVASGPRELGGGALILTGSDRTRAEHFMRHDPLVAAGKATFELIAFTATRAYSESLVDQ